MTASFDSARPEASKVVPPMEILSQAALAVGHVHFFPDPDGVVRSVWPAVTVPPGTNVPALSLALTLRDPAREQLSIGSSAVRTLDGAVPTGRGSLMDINFADARTFRRYSAIDVMRDDVPDGAFEDSIVLVGASALDLGDTEQTPAGEEPGVLVHASALNTLLNGAYLRPDPTSTTLLIVLVVALAVALGVGLLPIWLTPLAPVAAAGAFVVVAGWRFDGGTVTNLVYPLFAIPLTALLSIGTRYFTEVRERRRVTRVFGRYLSQDVVEEVLNAPGQAIATLEGASPEISVLFADLRGFTSASESLPPRTVVSALNVFLDAMTRAVIEERGTIDKFMGDCVMAFWNAPRPEPNHAECAVRAALRMQRYIREAMERGEVADLPVRGCGVGIATGEAVVGNIGSAQRLDYTVIGDTVNTASRLCGVAEAGEVVVTEACADRVSALFDVTPLPPVSVKGKEEPLRVFRVSERGAEAAGPAGTPAEGVEAPEKAAGYAPVEPVTE
jgi:adenylate cyclase